MRHIYPQCHFVKEQHERRDAVKRQFVTVVNGGNPAAAVRQRIAWQSSIATRFLSALMVIRGLKMT